TQAGNGAESLAVRAFGDAAFPDARKKSNDKKQANDATEGRAKKKSQKCPLHAEECAHHQHHFDVAHTHAFTPTYEAIERSCREQKETSRGGPQKSASNAQKNRILRDE